ncbi:hypothetical protein H9Q74_012181 [Fusarium xylarioides]|nr:hypothetical protein H9Q71_012144 [Fusarium xylarioides]KAG5814531.1 hypothetical protein H9Q74_012181 [Fusarium xylarioides]
MASLNSTIIFEAAGKRYVTTEAIPFQPQANPHLKSQLTTVFANHDGVTLCKEWLETYLDKLDSCDVYDRNLFLSGVIITTPRCGQAVPQDSWEYLKELGMKWLDIAVQGGKTYLPTGPYLYTDNKLYPVCRLYDDEKIAFFSGLKPKLDLSSLTEFEQLGTASTSNNCLAIAVPSRAPTLVTSTPPNLRVAVKDCFRVSGMKTSLCNKAYHELSEPATFTADMIQALIDDGAHILGLTKLSSMIAREEPMDAVDYPTAFNPRGDGYQSPAGSSSGSAAAVAAYYWLDCAIGTDTSGSGRRPALANGVWQFRSSHDSVSLGGLVKTYAMFDTPCVFARSLDAIRRVAKTWIAAPLPVKKRSYPSCTEWKPEWDVLGILEENEYAVCSFTLSDRPDGLTGPDGLMVFIAATQYFNITAPRIETTITFTLQTSTTVQRMSSLQVATSATQPLPTSTATEQSSNSDVDLDSNSEMSKGEIAGAAVGRTIRGLILVGAIGWMIL